ncbi:hypothetical protein GCM10012280_11080 [Wenjunlia tyrosinilytica]|uniref:Uncharacterized protein n=1 Tax=Wenjunlia tyrosinilytica TaxID=1544741 RepID=A0A917ZHT3_9ACTN|nr:hypothetical protein GCM10012280_11080 [Wenjunlia tyrosinilytica]
MQKPPRRSTHERFELVGAAALRFLVPTAHGASPAAPAAKAVTDRVCSWESMGTGASRGVDAQSAGRLIVAW